MSKPGLSMDLPPRDQFALQGRILDRTVWSYDEPTIGTKAELQEAILLHLLPPADVGWNNICRNKV